MAYMKTTQEPQELPVANAVSLVARLGNGTTQACPFPGGNDMIKQMVQSPAANG